MKLYKVFFTPLPATVQEFQEEPAEDKTEEAQPEKQSKSSFAVDLTWLRPHVSAPLDRHYGHN
jgi:arginine exporter protein ArgO